MRAPGHLYAALTYSMILFILLISLYLALLKSYLNFALCSADQPQSSFVTVRNDFQFHSISKLMLCSVVRSLATSHLYAVRTHEKPQLPAASIGDHLRASLFHCKSTCARHFQCSQAATSHLHCFDLSKLATFACFQVA